MSRRGRRSRHVPSRGGRWRKRMSRRGRRRRSRVFLLFSRSQSWRTRIIASFASFGSFDKSESGRSMSFQDRLIRPATSVSTEQPPDSYTPQPHNKIPHAFPESRTLGQTKLFAKDGNAFRLSESAPPLLGREIVAGEGTTAPILHYVGARSDPAGLSLIQQNTGGRGTVVGFLSSFVFPEDREGS